MVGDEDSKDKNESRKVLIALVSLIVILVAATALVLPLMAELVAVHFSPGLGLKDSAVIAFFTTTILMIVLAVASGDGLLGELQFIVSAFFLFFIIIWLMVAWIF